MIALAAFSRGDVANYVDALFEVYIVIIFVYILLNLLFSFGLKTPYSRVSDAILGFLRDVCEPYLRVFRRFIPAVGAVDFSPMLAIIALFLIRTILDHVIRG
jgi:YggT family protein